LIGEKARFPGKTGHKEAVAKVRPKWRSLKLGDVVVGAFEGGHLCALVEERRFSQRWTVNGRWVYWRRGRFLFLETGDVTDWVDLDDVGIRSEVIRLREKEGV
jgi:hypothetical protein